MWGSPLVIVREAPPVAGVIIIEEEAATEVPYVEETATAQMVIEEVGAAEMVVEEEATAEGPVEETTTTEMVVEKAVAVETVIEEAAADEVAAEEVEEETVDEGAEGATEEATEEVPEETAEEAPEEAAEEATEEIAEEATADVPAEPSQSAPHRPSGISFRLEATSSDDLDELYASLHEEGGSSASAPLDEDSKTVIERLREFLLLGVQQMTATGALMEFRSCLDTAMAIGLLDSAQLDELQARLAEGEEMISRYAEAVTRMAEGSSLEQDLVEIKEKVQPAMARLKENDLARRALILQRRDGAVATGRELKSSAKQVLKAATETKKALAERKLIRARWQADIDGGDIAWRKITCLIWGMFSEGV
ncbi:uncharacterized protein Pyn_34077 [Prunus yedoensis var. nudiflora]|uniref:Uncharacterized protein n=1 Tax=Prunus yedoensis var. nudiflora TaxID=2094558 RepID=A0A314XFF4_PRUYE|nr:uncharacterized protein Pyn_34077 [Prunus yedoensis var. nudiflora]